MDYFFKCMYLLFTNFRCLAKSLLNFPLPMSSFKRQPAAATIVVLFISCYLQNGEFCSLNIRNCRNYMSHLFVAQLLVFGNLNRYIVW